jgi:hypothetical protein
LKGVTILIMAFLKVRGVEISRNRPYVISSVTLSPMRKNEVK